MDRYQRLIAVYSPRPIRSHEDYKDANKKVSSLMEKEYKGEGLTQEEKDLLEVYDALIYFYDTSVRQKLQAKEDRAAPPGRPQEILNTPCPTGEFDENIDNLTLLQAKELLQQYKQDGLEADLYV